ncbi:MAG TPA: hypothetical protein VN870_00165, partial [Streptosporangiaceae bacterium]|nr:hypothetical protein [Streptosporangiaceae bacterium]
MTEAAAQEEDEAERGETALSQVSAAARADAHTDARSDAHTDARSDSDARTRVGARSDADAVACANPADADVGAAARPDIAASVRTVLKIG